MKIVKNIAFTCLLLGLFLMVQSCKKTPENTQTDFKQDMAVVSDAQFLQQFANQFMLTFFKTIYDSTLINTGLSKVDTAKVMLNQVPDTLEIKVEYWYENENNHWHHYDGYGHFRMGTFTYVMDTTFLVSTTGSCSIMVDKLFYFDSLPTNIQNISIEKTGLSAAGNQTFKATFNNMVMSGTYTGKKTRTFSATFNYELFKDATTLYSSPDDYFLFTGNIQGNTTSDYTFNIAIPDTSRYKIDYNCRYTIEGKSNVTISGGPVFSDNILMDYITEDGCANFYQITFPEMFSTKSHIE